MLELVADVARAAGAVVGLVRLLRERPAPAKPRHHGKRWTAAEDAYLKLCRVPDEQAAAQLGREPGAVAARRRLRG